MWNTIIEYPYSVLGTKCLFNKTGGNKCCILKREAEASDPCSWIFCPQAQAVKTRSQRRSHGVGSLATLGWGPNTDGMGAQPRKGQPVENLRLVSAGMGFRLIDSR
jgi:hypothetical protein